MDFKTIKGLISKKIQDGKGVLTLSRTDIDNPEFQSIFDLLKTDSLQFAVPADSASGIAASTDTLIIKSEDYRNNSSFLGFQAPGDNAISLTFTSTAGELDVTLAVILANVQASKLVENLTDKGFIEKGRLENIAAILNPTFKTLLLTVDGQARTLQLEEEATVPQAWDILSAAGIDIREVGIGVEYTLGQDLCLFFSTNTMIGNIPMDIQLVAPTGLFDGPDNWKLKIANSIEVKSLVNDLASFIAKASPSLNDFSSLFPDALKNLAFDINDFTILFHPLRKSISFISFNIDSENQWDIIPGRFTVQDLGMGIYINFVGASSVDIVLHGLLLMGEYDSINVSINVSTDKNQDWELDLDASISLSSINDLCKLPVNIAPADIALPEGFITLSELDFPLFKLTFNPFKGTVSDIALAMSARMDCDLIPGLLEIQDPSIGIDVTDPFGSSRSITGSVEASVDIAKVAFDVTASRSPQGWDFTGKSMEGDINLKQIIDYFLPKEYQLPSVFSLDVSSLEWDYSRERFMLSTEIDFDFGFGSEKATVNFVHTSAEGLPSYSFTVDFQVDDDYIFELGVDYSRPGTILKGALKSASGKGLALNIDKVLGLFHVKFEEIGLPLVDSIVLDSASLAIDLDRKVFRLEGLINGALDVVLEAQNGPKGWGVALGVEYENDINLSSLLAGTSLPVYVELGELFMAFSTIDQTVNFGTGNQQSRPMQLTRDCFSLGGTVKVKDNPGQFISGLADTEEDLFISGSIDLAKKVLDLKVALQVKEGSHGIVPKNYPSIPMAGMVLELTLLEEDILLSLAGEMQLSLFDRTILMDGRITFEEMQLEVSATLSGDPVKIPLILGLQFEFTDLAFELGDSYELEEPAIGYCGDVTFANFNAFEAVMIDSGEPENCLFVLNLSNIPELALFDILMDLCTAQTGKIVFLDALKSIKFTGTPVKRIPYTDQIAGELDKGKECPEVASIVEASNYYITSGEKGSGQWFFTDRNNVITYVIRKLDNQLDITKEIQIYIVPGETYYIGTKEFPQGVRFNGRLEMFGFSIEADLEVSSQGISMEADCSPLDLGGVVKFTGATDNSKGPRLSIDTIKAPHLYLDGKLSLLGLSDSVHADISSSGITCTMSTDLEFFKDAISVTTQHWESLTLKSSVSLNFSVKLPYAISVDSTTVVPIMTVPLNFSAALTVAVDTHGGKTLFSGHLDWNGKKIYTLKDEPVTVDDLTKLEEALINWVKNNAEKIFAIFEKDVNFWLEFIKTRAIDEGIFVASVMRSVFNYKDASKIASAIKDIFSPEDLARNLSQAAFTNPQIATAMYNEVSKDANKVCRIFKEVLKVNDAKEIKSLLSGAGFQDVDQAIDKIFHCSCYAKVSCVAHCPADCPGKIHCPADCPAVCTLHCAADCPIHCVADCGIHCPGDCPVHCVTNCVAHCFTKCFAHCLHI